MIFPLGSLLFRNLKSKPTSELSKFDVGSPIVVINPTEDSSNMLADALPINKSEE